MAKRQQSRIVDQKQPLTNEQIDMWIANGVHFPARFPELARFEFVSTRLGLVLRVTEHVRTPKDVLIQRMIHLDDVRSVFLPPKDTADPQTISLSDPHAVWYLGDKLKDAKVQKEITSWHGIVFVEETARVLNVVSVAASARRSTRIERRLRVGRTTYCV